MDRIYVENLSKQIQTLTDERNALRAALDKGGAFLALYSQLHGDDLAETDDEVALTDACNEFGDALDALRDDKESKR